jgi:hypothetical protein
MAPVRSPTGFLCSGYTNVHREVAESKDVGHLLERALTERALSSDGGG